MSSRTYQLEQGAKYYAGADIPWYIPTSIVTRGAEDLGFRAIKWHERKKEALPPGIDPRSDAGYSDAWQEWAEGIYTGPSGPKFITYGPCWVVRAPVVPAPARATSAPSSASQGSPWGLPGARTTPGLRSRWMHMLVRLVGIALGAVGSRGKP
jgi:hypothetical protein